MAAKTVVCGLCGEHVNKRQTLSLTELGGKAGRACRDHPEVIELELQKTRAQEKILAERKAKKKAEQEHERFVMIQHAVTMVRVMQSRQENPEIPFIALSRCGYSPDEIEQIKEFVARRADESLSEMEKGIAAQILLADRKERTA